jgi:hypothetical protein
MDIAYRRDQWSRDRHRRRGTDGRIAAFRDRFCYIFLGFLVIVSQPLYPLSGCQVVEALCNFPLPIFKFVAVISHVIRR